MVEPQTPGVPDHAAPESPETARDARERAIRTFVQGLLMDMLLAVAIVVQDAMSSSADGIEWGLLGLVLVKTVLTAAASYVMRVLKPPT